MSNVTTTNPIILDTAVGNWAALELLNNLPIAAKKIVFNGAAAKDTAVISDVAGNVLFKAVAEGAGTDTIYDFNPVPLVLSKPNGWYLSQISSSGILTIYY